MQNSGWNRNSESHPAGRGGFLVFWDQKYKTLIINDQSLIYCERAGYPRKMSPGKLKMRTFVPSLREQ
jgi:hypothetical protein